jgi:putative oxidoreductase
MTTLIFGNKISSTRQDITLLIGRIALGIVLIAHGWQKFFTFGISGVAANFDTMGVPLPAVSATFAAVVELVGGILLIIGLAVPLVGLLVAVDMAGALLFVHAPNGVFVDGGGYELVLVIGALGVVFAGVGAGAYAIDRLIASRSRRSPVAA